MMNQRFLRMPKKSLNINSQQYVSLDDLAIRVERYDK